MLKQQNKTQSKILIYRFKSKYDFKRGNKSVQGLLQVHKPGSRAAAEQFHYCGEETL